MKRPPPEIPKVVRLAASCFGIGETAPVAPATLASLACVPLLYLFLAWPGWVQAMVVLGIGALAVRVSTRAEGYYGHDASAIVIDEVVGMAVTVLWLPRPESTLRTLGLLGTGFVLFRFFDVVKPFPAGRAQRLPGGWGVVMDDVFAGVYANLGCRAALVMGWL